MSWGSALPEVPTGRLGPSLNALLRFMADRHEFRGSLTDLLGALPICADKATRVLLPTDDRELAAVLRAGRPTFRRHGLLIAPASIGPFGTIRIGRKPAGLQRPQVDAAMTADEWLKEHLSGLRESFRKTLGARWKMDGAWLDDAWSYCAPDLWQNWLPKNLNTPRGTFRNAERHLRMRGHQWLKRHRTGLLREVRLERLAARLMGDEVETSAEEQLLEVLAERERTEQRLERERAVNQALDLLDDDSYRVIISRYWDGRSYTEVAAELGLSRSKVYRLHEAALDLLRRCQPIRMLGSETLLENCVMYL